MAFLETPRFPECVSLGAEGGPAFLTDIVAVASGYEYRNRAREKALGRWEVAHNALLPADYEPLRAFFLVAAGQFNGFRFKDHSDFEVGAGEGVFVLLTATTFQMYKRYTIGASTYDRKIQKPVTGTVTVTGGSSVSVNYTTGIVTVNSGTPTSWVGQFDVPCRFGTDEMKAETITKTGSGELLIGWRSIPIIEIRV